MLVYLLRAVYHLQFTQRAGRAAGDWPSDASVVCCYSGFWAAKANCGARVQRVAPGGATAMMHALLGAAGAHGRPAVGFRGRSTFAAPF